MKVFKIAVLFICLLALGGILFLRGPSEKLPAAEPKTGQQPAVNTASPSGTASQPNTSAQPAAGAGGTAAPGGTQPPQTAAAPTASSRPGASPTPGQTIPPIPTPEGGIELPEISIDFVPSDSAPQSTPSGGQPAPGWDAGSYGGAIELPEVP